MLLLTIPAGELWDERTETFSILKKDCKLSLEHSLLSISKWESKWKKPFITKDDKTPEELKDYVRCMTINQNVPDVVYDHLSATDLYEVKDYIEDSMTATTFGKKTDKRGSKRIITSELIYYWMITLQIPVEFEKWHLNRLLTLIEVCNEENKEPTKRSPKSIMSHNAALNKARRAAMHSKG